MCLTYSSFDAREVRLLRYINQPVIEAVLALNTLLSEASDESKALFSYDIGRGLS